MPAGILRLPRGKPGVKPVVVVSSIPPPIAIGEFGVIRLHAGVRLADDDPLASHAELGPDPVRADVGQVPLRLGGGLIVAGGDRQRSRQGAQHRTGHDPVHFGAACQPEPVQQPALYLQRVDQVIGRVMDVHHVQRGAEVRLGGVCALNQRVVDELAAPVVVLHIYRRRQVGLIFQDHEQLVAVEAGLTNCEVNHQPHQPECDCRPGQCGVHPGF